MTKNLIIQILFFYNFIYKFHPLLHCFRRFHKQNFKKQVEKSERLRCSVACTKYKKWPWSSHLQFLDDSLVKPSKKLNVLSQNQNQIPGLWKFLPLIFLFFQGVFLWVNITNYLPYRYPPQKRISNSKEQCDDVK